MFGFNLRRDPYDLSDLDDQIGKNSEVFALGDAVVLASGFLRASAAGEAVLGFANQALTMASNNETVAMATVEFVPAYPNRQFECDFSAAVTQATAVGFYADLTGGTGAQQLDQSTLSSTTGQFFVTKLDPRGEGSTTRVLCVVAEPQSLNF